MQTWRYVSALGLCALVGGCAGNGEGLDENGRPDDGSGGEGLQPTFSSIQENVFTPICSVCHSGASAPIGLRLDEGFSYALLVNEPSGEVPSLNRVTPGDPDASYLIQKIEGTADVGGRMPLNQSPLPPDVIAVIRQWIAEGAVDDTATASAAPSLASVSVESGATLKRAPQRFLLVSNAELDTALLQADLVTLMRSGADGSFTDGNELRVAVSVGVRSRAPTVLAVVPQLALPNDTYELRVSGSAPLALTDLAARAVDGDGDGEQGGDLIVRFAVENNE